MTWRTHFAVGVNAVWLTAVLPFNPQSLPLLIFTAGLASLLPDIDASAAKIHFIGGGVFGIFRGGFWGKLWQHRGLMHSLPMAIFLSLILAIFVGQKIPALPYIFFAAFFSHSFIDAFNGNVGFLFPFVKFKFTFVPKMFRARVGSNLDTLIFFLALAFLLLYFWMVKDLLFLSSTGV